MTAGEDPAGRHIQAAKGDPQQVEQKGQDGHRLLSFGLGAFLPSGRALKRYFASINAPRSEPRGAAPLAPPDWLRVDERGRRLSIARVLPAGARRGGERERRPLSARTLPRLAALAAAEREQRPATVLALPEAAVRQHGVCELRPAMAHALLAARQGGASRGQRPAMALTLLEAAVPRYAGRGDDLRLHQKSRNRRQAVGLKPVLIKSRLLYQNPS